MDDLECEMEDISREQVKILMMMSFDVFFFHYFMHKIVLFLLTENAHRYCEKVHESVQ